MANILILGSGTQAFAILKPLHKAGHRITLLLREKGNYADASKYVYKSIMRQSGRWDIVLLHDIHKTSVEGFIKALPKLKKDNFELVTVSELYQIYGKKMKSGVMYYGPRRDEK